MHRGRLDVLAAAALWSTAGAAIKLCALTGPQIVVGRSLVAAATLFALVPAARTRPTGAAAAAASYAATVALFVLATKHTTAANAIFLQATAPLYVLALSPFWLGERASAAELRAAPVFGAGLLLFFLDRLAPGQQLGNALALASGVAFACCIMAMRRLPAGGGAALAWGNALAALAMLPFAAGGPAPALRDAAIVVFLGVIQLGLAYALFARGLARISAVEASLLALLEPVLNPVWAFLLTGERPGPWACAGGAVIIAAAAWRALAPRAATPPPPPP